eukprot:TRINITY_DN5936_c0_g2_i1.p1 TRINITY_DN5936_c0_g2~~TRINITY_DN5936_c0_g2_i1.p1  ORF type:complete len:477 (-),score=71.86 TRINITY_DN5936_c0_g2_i1:135-1565(-)
MDRLRETAPQYDRPAPPAFKDGQLILGPAAEINLEGGKAPPIMGRLNTLLERGCMGIQKLNLSDNPGILTDPTCVYGTPWASLDNLLELGLARCWISSDQFANFLYGGQPSSVRILDVSGNPGILGNCDKWSIAAAELLNSVQEFNVSCCQVERGELDGLLKLGSFLELRKLDLSENPGVLQKTPDSTAPDFSGLAKLEELNLAKCLLDVVQLESFINEGQPFAIRSLNLSDNEHLLGVGMAHAASRINWQTLGNLDDISMANCKITGNQLERFISAEVGAQWLRRLDVSGNPGILDFTNTVAGYANFYECLYFEELNLTECSVTAKQLRSFLAQSQPVSLRRLDLTSNPGVTALWRRHPGQHGEAAEWDKLYRLQELSLTACQITRDELSELILALPDSVVRLYLDDDVAVDACTALLKVANFAPMRNAAGVAVHKMTGSKGVKAVATHCFEKKAIEDDVVCIDTSLSNAGCVLQ